MTAPGTIDAFQQVQITARVAGAVDKVAFIEGQEVKKGDVLVVIETRALPGRGRAGEGGAREGPGDARRRPRPSSRAGQGAQRTHPGLVPGEEIEQYETARRDREGRRQAAAQQALRVAQLNLRDSYVRAPIAGVVQTRTVQTGQYLQPGAVLATLLQRDPLLLRFRVTEQDAPRLKPG